MKEKMKIYHGIPKSVTDENTVFYASFDGSVKPEIGSISNYPNGILIKPNLTGYGVYNSSAIMPTELVLKPSTKLNGDITMEFCITNQVKSDLTRIVRLNFGNIDLDVIYHLGSIKFRFMGIPNPTTIEKAMDIFEISHVRFTLRGNEMRGFVNGTLIGVKSVDMTNVSLTNEPLVYINRLDTNNASSSICISDLHISNIDRGDFFPTLPQDFIEGKAIIKERFGQQQIKGDPMYSQVTELKVPNWNNVTNFYDDSIRDSSNCYPSIVTPELWALGSSTWGQNDKIKIKGLNGEIISGVIDTDTALLQLVSYVSTTEAIVDDISKISINDEVRFFNKNTHNADKAVHTIIAIDIDTKKITTRNNAFNEGTISNGWIYLLEITASSSSPVVKSQDGRTVVGTWSGLGTNEATFTLGTNTPSLEGKDLYVTYSLNIPSNNSHFPDIPYSVDKAFTETGVEMKPVTEIVIEDDFRGKISGSTKECPHIYSYSRTKTSLAGPNEGTECSQASYERLLALDGNTTTVFSSDVGALAQQIYNFNLIQMVESKLGCAIPSSDKAKWLKDNVLTYTATAICFASNGVDYKCQFKNYCYGESRWYSDRVEHQASAPRDLTYKQSVNWVAKAISSEGILSFLIVSEPCVDGQRAFVETDYIRLEIILKLPSNYQALYSDNKRAREDVCNPILVQKETKTVRRLLPSKECFTTESKSGVSKNSTIDVNTFTVLHKSDFSYLTTQGTGVYNAIQDYYRESIAKLGVTTRSFEYMNDDLFISPYVGGTNSKFLKIPSTSHPLNNFDLTPLQLPNESNLVTIKPMLVSVNNELSLALYINEVRGKSTLNSVGWRLYKLANRPLIK